MGKYYYLIAGLPNISLEDNKVPYTLAEFRDELDQALTRADRKLIDLFFLKFENRNLISQIRFPDADLDDKGRITFDEFSELIKALKDGKKLPKNKRIPPYFVEFIQTYLNTEEEEVLVAWEDRLAGLYYNQAIKCQNQFVSEWFELNLNINNILTAITCRKYGFDKANFIVGDNEIAQKLRLSNARDFGLGESFESFSDIQRIAEETDLLLREKKLDVLRWQWLDDKTFFKAFEVEIVFTYLVRLEMMERWTLLDKAMGEKTLREMIGEMKTGSNQALNEFKRNN